VPWGERGAQFGRWTEEVWGSLRGSTGGSGGICRMKKTRSLFLFGYDNPARQIARDTCTSPWFDSIILLVIVGNAIMMAVDDPLDDSRDACPRDPCPDDARTALELLCNLIFTAELLVKVFSFGFVIGEGTYLRSGWNILDFIIGAPLCRSLS
jgi:hypothetical protein